MFKISYTIAFHGISVKYKPAGLFICRKRFEICPYDMNQSLYQYHNYLLGAIFKEKELVSHLLLLHKANEYFVVLIH